LRELEALIDEYYMASGLDRRRLTALRRRILELTQSSGLDVDAGIADAPDEQAALQKLDTYLCELKEAQIRDGLHVLGTSPEGALETNLLVALARIARGHRGRRRPVPDPRAGRRSRARRLRPVELRAGRALDGAAAGGTGGSQRRGGAATAIRWSGWNCWPRKVGSTPSCQRRLASLRSRCRW
jgi:cobalamin biosynthesis Mg chelatase CobN